jgi:hypothetical protein
MAAEGRSIASERLSGLVEDECIAAERLRIATESISLSTEIGSAAIDRCSIDLDESSVRCEAASIAVSWERNRRLWSCAPSRWECVRLCQAMREVARGWVGAID